MRCGFVSALVIVFSVMCFFSCSHNALVRQQALTENGCLIRNVKVFTAVPDKPVLEDADVYIKGRTIARVSAERLDIPGAEVIDGKGKTLLPGLIDFHTHIAGSTIIPWGDFTPTLQFNLEGCLYSGVTAIVDMNGEPAVKMKKLSSAIEEGRILGPHLYHCGMGFTGKGAWPVPLVAKIKETLPWFIRPLVPRIVIEVQDTGDMAEVESHLAAQPDFTKIYLDDLPDGMTKTKPEIVKEIVMRSHAKGIPAVIHIGRNEDVKIAIESGADALAHNVYKEPLDPGLARELARRNIFVIPTVYVFQNVNTFVNEKDYNHYAKIEWETMHRKAVKALQNPKPYPVIEGDPWGDYYRHFRETYTSVLHPNVSVLKDAGVTIIAGTDSPNLGIASGGALHIELIHLVEGGLTPSEALTAATSTPARTLREVFHRDVDFGTIEEGKGADLLLVNGDPLTNIGDTQNISAVFYRGSRIQRGN